MIGNILTRALLEDEIYRVEERQERLAPGWYAEGGGVRFGPFEREDTARNSLRLSSRARAKQYLEHHTDYPFPIDLRVWEEF